MQIKQPEHMHSVCLAQFASKNRCCLLFTAIKSLHNLADACPCPIYKNIYRNMDIALQPEGCFKYPGG